MGTQDNAASGYSTETFGTCVDELSLDGLNVIRKALSLLPKSGLDQDYQATQRTKDLSAFMAYTANLAFFAYTKPHQIDSDRQIGVKENLANGATIQHVHKVELVKSVEKIVRFRVTRCTIEESTNSTSEEIDPYLIFTHGTSMVKCKISEDTTNTTESSYHYLFIKKNTSGDIKSYICSRHVESEKAGQNEPLSAFGIDLKSNTPPSLTELTLANLSSTTTNTSLERDFGGKKITVEFCYEAILVADFVNPSQNLCNFLWLDESDTDYFGVRDYNWEELINARHCTAKKMYPMAYIDQDSSATQAWLYVNRDEQILVLAFPGTDTNEDQDVDTSADTRRVKLKTAWKRLSNSDLEAGNLGPSLKVHEGYKKAYLSVRNTLLDIVDSVTEWSTQWTIIVTGHSLGGSLATIAAYDLATITDKDTSNDNPPPKLAMFTFAAPAVGNNETCYKFSQVVPLGFRVVVDDDAVANTMHSPLRRLGKLFPCNVESEKSLDDIVNAQRKIVECDALAASNAARSLPDFTQAPADWEKKVEDIPLLEKLKHLEDNYFKTIQGFLDVVFS